jgi:pyruvate/2-oxoglutarate dehydrogenase complex dihydrolipoamide acyltransferase (E2) component
MPPLGDTTDEVRLVRWHKREGERVEKGELLFDVETDKATVQVEALYSGTLRRIQVGDDTTTTAGTVVGWIED